MIARNLEFILTIMRYIDLIICKIWKVMSKTNSVKKVDNGKMKPLEATATGKLE